MIKLKPKMLELKPKTSLDQEEVKILITDWMFSGIFCSIELGETWLTFYFQSQNEDSKHDMINFTQ